MSKASKDQVDERLRDTERLLIRRRSYSDVERELANKHGVTKRTARKWIQQVRARWREESDAEDAPEARAALVEQLNAVISDAWNHREVVKDGDGKVVLDQNPASPGYGKPILKPSPRHQQILHAVSQLRALQGADKPAKAVVTLDLPPLPDVGALPDSVQDSLRKALEAVAPNGDVRQLAGEWIREEKPEGT